MALFCRSWRTRSHESRDPGAKFRSNRFTNARVQIRLVDRVSIVSVGFSAL